MSLGMFLFTLGSVWRNCRILESDDVENWDFSEDVESLDFSEDVENWDFSED